MRRTDAIVAGVGEIGGPLAEILATRWLVQRLDLDKRPDVDSATFLHVCYPYQIDDFAGETARYSKEYSVDFVVVHSTVLPGTTSRIQNELPDVPVFYSPVRGKHDSMTEHMLRYRKFIAGPKERIGEVIAHFEAAGLETDRMDTTDELELAKLLETTYFGVLIAWAQETERYAKVVGSDFQTVSRFFEEIPFLPDGYFPGYIGGHCVMPNIKLLQDVRSSDVLQSVQRSNESYSEEAGTEVDEVSR